MRGLLARLAAQMPHARRARRRDAILAAAAAAQRREYLRAVQRLNAAAARYPDYRGRS